MIKPLTLEQLKFLHGKPVWCYIPGEVTSWGVVDITVDQVILGETYRLSFDHYGEWYAVNTLLELENIKDRHNELLKIMNRAEMLARRSNEEERVRFKMDENGNLTRIEGDVE